MIVRKKETKRENKRKKREKFVIEGYFSATHYGNFIIFVSWAKNTNFQMNPIFLLESNLNKSNKFIYLLLCTLSLQNISDHDSPVFLIRLNCVCLLTIPPTPCSAIYLSTYSLGKLLLVSVCSSCVQHVYWVKFPKSSFLIMSPSNFNCLTDSNYSFGLHFP